MPQSSANIDQNAARRAAALRILDARIDYERARNVPYSPPEFKLQRMRELLARVGNPHQKLPIVHVAGTKGKGSTAAMIGAVLSAAGYSTGVFTSPHLDRLEQRMAIDGRPCSPAELVELLDRLSPAVKAMDEAASASAGAEIGPTYFEIATAMAMLHFACRPVDAAVLEVGLGGRLDSTNVCDPRVSVITSISFDHTQQLGDTLESIAQEKAGIVKPGVPVISGVVPNGPRQAIRRVCRQRGCRLTELGTDFHFEYHPPLRLDEEPTPAGLDFCHENQRGRLHYGNLALGLVGRHQAANAAVALATLVELQQSGWRISEEAIRRGLSEVVFPARVEVLGRRPAIVVDVAHNPASVDALIQVLRESFSAGRRLLVFAATQEKDLRGMLERLLGEFDQVFLTRYLNNPRAVPPEDLQAIAAELTGRRFPVYRDPAEAWSEVRSLASPRDLICVTGSFFLAAEIRRLILNDPPTLPAETLEPRPT